MKALVSTVYAMVLVLVLSLAPTLLVAGEGDFVRAVRFRAAHAGSPELAEAVQVVIDHGFLSQIVEAKTASHAQASPSAPTAEASAAIEKMIEALRAAEAYMADDPGSRWHSLTSITAKGTGESIHWEVVVSSAPAGRRSPPTSKVLFVSADLRVAERAPQPRGRRRGRRMSE